MNINIPNKTTGDLHAASEFNAFKEAINSKADQSSLQEEIDSRIANELEFEAGFQTKVNKTDYSIDLTNLVAADAILQSQIDLLSGGTDIDLTKYLTISGASSTYQLKGDYLLESDVVGKFLSTGTTLFSGSYPDLIDKPQLFSGVYGDLAGLPSLFDGNYSSLSGLPQLFSGNYQDLINKPTIPNVTGLASESYVDFKISALVDNSPEVLNTLGELANSLGNDPAFATTVSNQIGLKANSADVYTKSEINLKGYLTGISYSQIIDKPNLFSGNYSDLSGLPNLFDGSYFSLSNRPVIPSISGLASESYVISSLSGKTNSGDSYLKNESDSKYSVTGHTHAYSSLTGLPTLQNIVLTTTGTTGVATLNGNNLNIPSYSGGSGTTLNGTGFVKANGTTITYDNSTYQTTSAATTALNLKANLASPTFTGTVSAPTPTAGDSTTKIATTAFVSTATSSLISNSSDTFGSKVTQIVSLTASEYAALGTKVATTLYLVN